MEPEARIEDFGWDTDRRGEGNSNRHRTFSRFINNWQQKTVENRCSTSETGHYPALSVYILDQGRQYHGKVGHSWCAYTVFSLDFCRGFFVPQICQGISQSFNLNTQQECIFCALAVWCAVTKTKERLGFSEIWFCQIEPMAFMADRTIRNWASSRFNIVARLVLSKNFLAAKMKLSWKLILLRIKIARSRQAVVRPSGWAELPYKRALFWNFCCYIPLSADLCPSHRHCSCPCGVFTRHMELREV